MKDGGRTNLFGKSPKYLQRLVRGKYGLHRLSCRAIACQIGDTLPSDIVNWRTSVSHSLEEDNEDN